MQCFENFGGGECPPVVARLPPLLGRVGRKTRFGIFNISLPTGYLPSLASIYAGIPLASTNGKSI